VLWLGIGLAGEGDKTGLEIGLQAYKFLDLKLLQKNACIFAIKVKQTCINNVNVPMMMLNDRDISTF
jgi:hypothetical protein